MRKAVSLLLAVVMAIGVIPSVSASATAIDFIKYVSVKTSVPEGYTGIYTAEDFRAIENSPKNNYVLMNDIVLSNWTPIYFAGILDGNGHTITLSINQSLDLPPTARIGLFSYLDTATIQDLSVEGSINIVLNGQPGRKASGTLYVGAIAGTARGSSSFDNCMTNVSVQTNENADMSIKNLGVGGMLGAIDGADVQLKYCYNKGSIAHESFTGGLVGTVEEGKVLLSACLNEGPVNAKIYAGGLIGCSNSTGSITIESCVNAASITAAETAGGLVGGRFVGNGTVQFTDCLNIGNITSKNAPSPAGGIVGSHVFSKLTRCVNIGIINGAPDGAIAGNIDSASDLDHCYWLTGTSQRAYGADGYGMVGNDPTGSLSKEAMAEQKSFQAFDFNTRWTMSDRLGCPYPRLSLKAFQSDIDGWSIMNTIKCFTYPVDLDYSTPPSRYISIFGSAYVASALDARGKTYESMMAEWGGNCFGMAATAVMFHQGLLQWNERRPEDSYTTVNSYCTGVGREKEDDPGYYLYVSEGSPITELIEQYQILQYGNYEGYIYIDSTHQLLESEYFAPGESEYARKHRSDGDYIEHVLEFIQNHSDPVIISMLYGSKDKDGNPSQSGHAVVARTDRKPEKMSDGWWRVYIYDPNKPVLAQNIIDKLGMPYRQFGNYAYDDIYVELNPDRNLWRYPTSINASEPESMRGSDNKGVKWMASELKYVEDGFDKTITRPEYMEVCSLVNSGIPTSFDETEPWVERWKDNLEHKNISIFITDDANYTIKLTSGQEIPVIDGYPYGPQDLQMQYHPNLSGDGNGGRLTIPYEDGTTVEYPDGIDITVVGPEAVINVASEGAGVLTIDSITDSEYTVASKESSEIRTQVTNVKNNSEYYSANLIGSLDTGESAHITYKDDCLRADADLKTGSLDLYEDDCRNTEPKKAATLNSTQKSYGADGQPMSDWAKGEIRKAYDLGLVPDVLSQADLRKRISREEFAAVAVKVYESLSGGQAIPAINDPFKDTRNLDVLKAYNMGIVDGYGSGLYGPNDPLNREQCATMLTRAYKKVSIPGWSLAEDDRFELTYRMPAPFADDSLISGWAKDSVYFMVANGILQGIGNDRFAPKNTTPKEEESGYATATREQALAIAVRMVENLK